MAMALKLVRIIGTILFIKSTLFSEVSGVDTITGTFEMVQKHPELNECAAAILQENEYIAVRRSQQTGKCESLHHSWGKDETMESEYDYAKKIIIKENFEPPKEVKAGTLDNWRIPGVLKTGAKIDLLMGPGKLVLTESQEKEVSLYNEDDRNIIIRYNGDKVSVTKGNGMDVLSYEGEQSGANDMVNISVLAQTHSLVVAVNGRAFTYSLERSFDPMRQLLFYPFENYPLFVGRVQFNGK